MDKNHLEESEELCQPVNWSTDQLTDTVPLVTTMVWCPPRCSAVVVVRINCQRHGAHTACSLQRAAMPRQHETKEGTLSQFLK